MNSNVDPLEKEIELAVVKYFKKNGWDYRKQSGQGDRGKTDKVLTSVPARIIFVEFKRSGKKPTELQQKEITNWLRKGFITLRIDNIEDGEFLCDYLNDEHDWLKHWRDPVKSSGLFYAKFRKYADERSDDEWEC